MTRPLPNDRIPLPTPAEAPPSAGQGPQRAAHVPVLPAGISACLFDLDGVLTQTAKVHAAAWKEMFDAFLRGRSEQTGEPFRPFKIASDYAKYVDGKLRQDGVRAFLASRTISLPEGSAGDPPTALTVHGLGNRKNDLVLDLIRRRGVDVYEGSVRFVEAVRDAGLRRAVVSASKNCQAVLAAAGIEHLFEVRVDGIVAAEAGLRGKPRPTRFSRRPPRWASSQLTALCSKTLSLGSRRAAPVHSGGWSASTAAGRPRPCAATAPTRWSAT